MATLASEESVRSAYEEVCKSYHAIDDFRMKLLGLLPLASLVGLFTLAGDAAVLRGNADFAKAVTFIATFAALFTVALLVYEIRGILRCSALIRRGNELEATLGVRGQFFVCLEAHECKGTGPRWVERTASLFDAKLAACFIYSLVVWAWAFTALHFGLEQPVQQCVAWASLSGVGMGVATFFLVRKLVAA